MKTEIKKLALMGAAIVLLSFVFVGCDEAPLSHDDTSADTAANSQAPAVTVNFEDIREEIEQIFMPQKEDFALDAVMIARYDGQGGAEYSIKCIDGDPMTETAWRAYASCVISEDVFGQFFGLFQRDTVGISALGFTDDEMLTEQWLIELNGTEAGAAVCEALEIVYGEMKDNPAVNFVNYSDVSH